MTLQHFNTLPQHQQHKQLLSDGVYLADHKADDTEALLFQLNNFFVEVGFVNEGDEVVYTRHFEDASQLEPYWQTVPVAQAVA